MLQDIAILTGGTVISPDVGYELKDASIELLGHARQVKVDKENTIHLLALIVLEYMLRQITCLLKPITSELMTLK